jgi:hypothetical protein
VYRILLLSGLGAALGCATIMSGSTEQVTIESEPSDAPLKLMPGFYEARTPASLDLPRGDAPYLVTMELAGYEPQRSYIRAAPNGWLWGNVLLGGPIGVIVDWATGALWKLEPTEIKLALAAKPDAAGEGDE